MLEPATALISLLVAAIGIISIIFSKPTVLFEDLGGEMDIVELERDFTEYTIKHLRPERAGDFYYVDRVRESFNAVIKTVGILENIIEQYGQGLLNFQRTCILFGISLLVAATAWIVISIYDYTTAISYFFIVIMSIIGAILFTIIVTISLRLRGMVKSYREYKKVLEQQRTNILFREVGEEA